MTDTDDALYSSGEASHLPRPPVSRDGILKAAKRGDLPIAMRAHNGQFFFRKADVLKWAAERRARRRRNRTAA